MNRKIKLSLITLLSVGCISVASLPLVSCGNSETTSKPDVVITGITLIDIPSLTYGELIKDSITLSTARKVFGGIDETNYEQFEISMSSWTGQVTMDLTAKEGFVFSDNKNILKSNSFLYPASPIEPTKHSFKTADGINISAKADGTASIIESSTTYTGSADLVIDHSYVSPTDSIRYGITSIGYDAFSMNKLTTLDLSKNTSLTTIGARAFEDNVLTTLDLSKNTSLTTIGERAFYYSELTTLDLSKNTSLISIGYGAFQRSKLTTLDLSKNTSLTSIGYNAFWRSKLTTLDLPTSLQTIGQDAFWNSLLDSLDLSKNTSLTTIGSNAFKSSKLTTLILPTSLISIGYGTFKSSTPITLVIPDSVTSIGDNAFESTRILKLNLEIPIRFDSPEELARIGITIIK